MAGVLMRREEDTLAHREGAPVTVEAEIGMIRPQAKEHYRVPGAASLVKSKEGFSLRDFRRIMARLTP